ncbi:disulfide bond formation protein B [Pollutimonas thiosulfatoxidans]|uniref:Disulfide bond formation protein B n=1 Tax=Pollutimonas thiosulfatoxidans TaxID=2028345 RepID=A0A410GAZ3_9BURK|nr:disulfide bond formation protein B [Pollutimonas thiosulfatoxidans]MBF6616301.1 disulfide bond formation protein B [Candidimonas sp.]QAA93459.1 disulfide bond formation protein B [Pollutimonas thiosulfatoxidans]
MTSSTRLLHFIALLCITAVAIALVSQHVFGLQPCAWCVLQRLVFILIALLCWGGLLAGRVTALARRAAGLLVTLLSVGGAMAAWYQYTVAAKMFSCDMTFADRFMVGSGLDANVPWLFGIYATCMDARVNLLGVEYALWSLGLFVVIGVLGLVPALRRLG